MSVDTPNDEHCDGGFRNPSANLQINSQHKKMARFAELAPSELA